MQTHDAAEISSYLTRMSHAVDQLSVPRLLQIARVFEQAYLAGRTIFTCGNGGSAATASHLAADLAKNTRHPGAPQVRTCSLVDHLAALTAWANDEGYASVFSGQLGGLAGNGDVVVGISTSGESANVLEAFAFASRVGATPVGILGAPGGSARDLCDIWISVPGASMEEQEDLHMTVSHILTRHMRRFVRSRADLPVSSGHQR